MYEDENSSEEPSEKANDPKAQAFEKADDFRMHAELAAVFEGPRKFDAQIKPGLDADIARDVQRTIAKLEKSRFEQSPFIIEEAMPEAARILDLPSTANLSTNDYHIHRRPGETMIVRWLAGNEVQTFYERLQAHFDAALNGFRQEERSNKEWQQDDKTLKYLDELDALDVKLEDRFFRQPIREHGLFVLSTQTADEMNIAYIADFIMSVPAAEIVGRQSAPPDEPSEKDLAWFFKLFMLRGVKGGPGGEEQMCFFTYLQKTEDDFDF